MIAVNSEPLGRHGKPPAGPGGAASFSRQMNGKLFLLYCTAAAADFHSYKQGGTPWQVAVSLISTVAFVAFVFNARRPGAQLRSLQRVTWLWWIYIATTPFIAYWRDVPAGHYLRILLPTLLMGESLIMGLLLLSESEENARLIFRGLFYASAVSSIVYLVRGLTMGLGLQNVRYYILSPLLIILFSFALCRLLFEGARAGIVNVVALTGGVIVIFLSVTRTYFAGIGVILLLLAYVLLRPPAWLNQRVRNRLKKNLLGVTSVLALLAAVVFVAFPGVVTHWSQRNASLGAQDPTALTRIAEAAGELQVMKKDKSHLLFGSGIGAEHKNDMRYLIGVSALAGEDYAAYTFSPGHIGWVYQFFTSGLLMGWVLPFIFLFAIWKGNAHGAPYIARLAAIAVAAALAITTLGNMLGDRGAGLGLGLLIALSLHGERTSAHGRRRAPHGIHTQFLSVNQRPVPALQQGGQAPLPASPRTPEGI
ncbi:MAG: hypothetical protein KGM96_09115 [Acidobacteriota bacterium]|nr:hypothetical protein [Acidobacteriota bacterium]